MAVSQFKMVSWQIFIKYLNLKKKKKSEREKKKEESHRTDAVQDVMFVK